VSIGLPVYNGEPHLRAALASLLGQSYGNMELIVSDNGSTDGTAQICRDFAAGDARVRYFRQPRNLGAAYNFGFVLEQAVGEFFMWAGCDDLWDPDWIAKLLSALAGDAALAFGELRRVDEQARVTETFAQLSFTGGRLRRMIDFYLAAEPGGKANLIYGLYRKTTLARVWPRYTQGAGGYGVDMHLVFDCLQYGAAAGVAGTSFYKRDKPAAPAEAGVRRRRRQALELFAYVINYSRVPCAPLLRVVIAVCVPLKVARMFASRARRTRSR
jgi:glycosyltransferase involved in cell wall biosynthesis